MTADPDFIGPPDLREPLDMLSGSVLVEGGVELTFRELQAHCQREIRDYDKALTVYRMSLTKIQRQMDPNYKPIEPGE